MERQGDPEIYCQSIKRAYTHGNLLPTTIYELLTRQKGSKASNCTRLLTSGRGLPSQVYNQEH
jgi:hypothetical protein